MPQLELTELEAKVCWIVLDHADIARQQAIALGAGEIFPNKPEANEAFTSLFDKVYRAYRGMPPEKAA